MKRAPAILLLVLAGVLAAGAYWKFVHETGESGKAAFVAKYYCSMHPSYTSDRPGTCPICGMALVPIPAEHAGHGAAASGVQGYATVMFNDKQLELVGIKTEAAAARPIAETMRLAGTVMLEKAGMGGGAWIYAPVGEAEAARIRTNQWADVDIPVRGRTLRGKVVLIDSDATLHTKIVKIKLAVSNPESFLKPEMGANVVLEFPERAAAAIPSAAVFHSGERVIAFVETEKGVFEPRELSLGAKSGEYYEVISGLKAGEKAVTSGLFLLDSESRILSGIERSASQQDAGAAHVH